MKRYERDGSGVRLWPESTVAGYEPLELDGSTDDEVRVIAELVEVLPGDGRG